MERHQGEMLLEVKTELHHQDQAGVPTVGPPSDRRGSFKCAALLAAVLGALVLVLVVGFCLREFLFPPSCEQEQEDLRCTLKETADNGIYDIFTANKAGNYRIYGWIRLPRAAAVRVTLKQTRDGMERNLYSKIENLTEVILFDAEALLPDKTRVRLHILAGFSDNFKDTVCHVRKLS